MIPFRLQILNANFMFLLKMFSVKIARFLFYCVIQIIMVSHSVNNSKLENGRKFKFRNFEEKLCSFKYKSRLESSELLTLVCNVCKSRNDFESKTRINGANSSFNV